MTEVDLTGLLRRIRRTADLSQRELAARIGISKSAVAAAESGRRGLDVRAMARAAEVAGLRLALVDPAGRELPGMDLGGVRDMGGRRFPAHLDTRHGDQDWWHDAHRYSRPRPWYTFDRDRGYRDARRADSGTPGDHQRPAAGDAPADRAAERQRESARRRAAEHQRRFLAGEFLRLPDAPPCTCPDDCGIGPETGPVTLASIDAEHVPDCVCRCDVG